MHFENSFTIDAQLQQVWDYLLNVREVAPCVPGAEITEMVSETEYKGSVKIKLGAVQMTYRGTVSLAEVDEQGHRVVLTASGNETRGTGSVSGTMTSELSPENSERTNVEIQSEINVTGRVAQFGRNIMQEVSARLIREFAQCLERKLSEQESDLSGNGKEADAKPTSELGARPPDIGSGTSAEAAPAEAQTPRELGVDARQPSRSTSALAGDTTPDQAEAIKMMPLLVSALRSRAAAALRKVAEVIEAKP